MKPETLSKIIFNAQEDYIRRKKSIEDYIPQSGLTDMLEERIYDYSSFIRTLENIREAVLKIETHQCNMEKNT